MIKTEMKFYKNEAAPPMNMISLKMPPAAIGASLVRYESLAGVDYQVYPCIMLVEGVHRGVGSGPVYYPPNMLAESAPMWNNVPVTVGHPVNLQGDHVLCNTDGTIRQQWEIGHVANARVEGGKLRADLWINVQRANDKANNLLPFLQNGGQLQVSAGMLAGLDGQGGVWNEEEYVGAVSAIVPDHLALLPGGTGACSWDDGCGVRIHQTLKKEPDTVIVMGIDLEKQLTEVRHYVDSMDVMDPGGERYSKVHFVRAVYSDYFVYQQREISPDGKEESKLYKQSYTMTDGTLEASGDPIEVVEQVKYKTVANQGIHPQNSTGGKNMGDKKQEKCCPEKVAALIANEATAYTDDDREWLESLNEEQLDKMESTAQVSEPEPEPKVEADPDPTGHEVTLASYLNEAPPEIRAVLNEGMRAMDEKRQGMMSKILAHEGNSFSEDQLKSMDTEMLDGIVSLIPKDKTGSNFLGANPQNNSVVNEGSEEEAYIPQTLGDALKKE